MKIRSKKLNVVLNVVKTISSIVFPLITFPYVSRILQPTNIGKYNFGSSYVSYFTLIAGLGVTTYAIRECAKVRDDRNKLNEISSQIFSINIFSTTISYILLFLSLVLFKNLSIYKNLIIIQSIVIVFTTLGADWINTAMEDFFYITVRTISFQFISLVLMLIFVRRPGDYIKYAIITVISSSGANLLNMFYRRKFCNMKFTFKIDWKRHLPPIMFLFVMSLSQTIFSSADVTMIGLFKNDYQVGLYSTATKMNQLVNQIVSSILWVFLPELSIYFGRKDYTSINRTLSKILCFSMIIGYPAMVGIMCLAKNIILIIGGKSYLGAINILRILMISFGFSIVGGSFLGNCILLPSGREKKFMEICLISALINVITNAIFIPKFGAIAAAVTTTFSSFIVLVLTFRNRDKKIKFSNIKKTIISVAVGCALIVLTCNIVLHFISNFIVSTIVAIILSVILYIAVLHLFKNEMMLELEDIALSKLKIRGRN